MTPLSWLRVGFGLFPAVIGWAGLAAGIGCVEGERVHAVADHPDGADPEAAGDEGGVLPVTVVEPGVLYRSGQPDDGDLTELLKAVPVKTIVNARGGPKDSGWYRREAEFARKHGINLVDLKVGIAGGPTPESAEKFLKIMADPAARPVLVHCKFGVHRTGHLVRLFQAHRTELLRNDPKTPDPGPMPTPTAAPAPKPETAKAG
jgi:protein tyrosine phosphatase (PTP) superfamily phosphohydrolase (DUF442 family)